MWAPMCVKSRDAFGLLGESKSCLSSIMVLVYVSLATIDFLIASVAGIQLLRQHLHNKRIGWTRQKVFHFLIGAANLGYVLYFILTVVAACKGWTCFSTACGFILIAAPQTLFLATFLLLLSFWVDLCNQANDNEEEDDDEMDPEYAQLPSSPNNSESGGSKPHRACSCLPFRRWRVRGRQRGVIAVVSVIFLLTVAVALLIWYDNPVDSVRLAQVYANFFALVILLSGGGLAGYGLLLYTKMSRVKSRRTPAEIRKVAGLAVASVVCFSLKAFLVVMSDLIDLNIWHVKRGDSQLCAPIILLYYLIGESVPSIVVLWVMRELPPRSRDNSMKGRSTAQEVMVEDALVPDPNYLSQLLSSAAGRQYLLVPNCCNSDVSPS
ncbi:hypothetical protein KC19_5G161500 [Ceratodon purpureus]|uniref:THH1/TOM1/TOM3 domain-containing protein n=1 Tax=Ceratodon purpureus TaxID=3225 RepID=A0A8T0I313_CERPU|nr:hypothetical protein KC19_5G161500 [Ceratodon purpureus]